MTEPREYSDVRYLRAKRSVDQRALNRPVLEQLRAAIAGLPAPVRVLELGAGVGTTVSRLADLGTITRARYTLIDQDRASLAAAAGDLRAWGGAAGGGVGDGGDGGGDAIVVRDGRRDLEVRLVAGNVFDWLAAADASADDPYDLVVAHAFLDLVDVGALLPALWRRLGPARPFWFTINFDGESIFLPETELDGPVLELYHRTMDERVVKGQPCGDSKTGRHHAARGIDVHRDLFLRVLRLEEEKLGRDQGRHVIFDRAGHEDHALLEEPRIDVERALATRRLLDDHWN